MEDLDVLAGAWDLEATVGDTVMSSRRDFSENGTDVRRDFDLVYRRVDR